LLDGQGTPIALGWIRTGAQHDVFGHTVLEIATRIGRSVEKRPASVEIDIALTHPPEIEALGERPEARLHLGGNGRPLIRRQDLARPLRTIQIELMARHALTSVS
jgi:hypothetical protein